jgi:heat shock protein HtpX
MKRILLFIATNLAVMLVLSIVVRLFGLDKYAASLGGQTGLLVFCAIFGFGGAIISLLLSKWTAKRAMGVRLIEQAANETEQWLLATVRSPGSACRKSEFSIHRSPTPSRQAHAAMPRWWLLAPACCAR